MHATLPKLELTDFPAIRRKALDTLQVNLGYLCNLSCIHCHVAAGPKRTELMDRNTIDIVLDFLRASDGQIKTLDVTGGSPEMNPHFRELVIEARRLGVHVMDRCNPTIIEEPGYDWVADFLAAHKIEVIASMPCYTADNVNQQRGKGVFDASISALQKLNARGYGIDGSGLELNLVYNPLGPSLPPNQQVLEAEYKQRLDDAYGIRFNNLFTLANMPIQRFGSLLISKGWFNDYMQLLKDAYRPANLDNVMCRNLISVDWRGYVYDCDFNQMLGLPFGGDAKPRTHLRELIGRNIENLPIAIADHCYGCTAGQGSSCGGALNQ
ncbi:MAG TPA: arsenosugar biosynthesis radical SAM (seleno)protein ArsS [Gammaproteobacteria bacterium]|nr:arsenosugar biosynthesis radical SAM (seleno)protein ArsS [Gammaproteobacteria bacterium]